MKNFKKLLATAIVAISGFASAASFLMTVPVGLSASTYHSLALVYAQQAESTYSVAFSDLPLWNEALAHAAAAVNLEPNSAEYNLTAAKLFAQAQWWQPAHQYFAAANRLEPLGFVTRQLAAITARKLAYMAIQRGDRAEATNYLVESLRYEETAATRAMLDKLQTAL